MRFEGTDTYIATPDLMLAVNAAIALERPLLVKGEPGTGKTMLAEEVARALGRPLLQWHIKSTTKAQQGLYEYDAVSRLRDSQLGDEHVGDIAHYIKRGVLWEAFEAPSPAVVLIDEVDKADIEFPNDLLRELDRMEFYVYETQQTIRATHRPLVVITSNNEKELPDAFLRRCFFHYIRFPDRETMTRIVDVHFPGLKKALLAEALEVFFNLREVPGLKKKPSTSELLDWLKLLLAEDIPPEALHSADKKVLIPPLHGALLKNEQDVHLFERVAFLARGGALVAFVAPVTLEGRHVVLSPMTRGAFALAIAAALGEAAADGELWDSEVHERYRGPRTRCAWTRHGAGRCARSWRLDAVRRPSIARAADIVGSTRYFNVEAPHRRLEIGHTWYRKARPAHGDQHRSEATCCSRTRSRRFAASQSSSARTCSTSQSRAAIERLGAKLDGHPAQPSDHARWNAARHGDVFSIIDTEWPAVKRSRRLDWPRDCRRSA